MFLRDRETDRYAHRQSGDISKRVRHRLTDRQKDSRDRYPVFSRELKHKGTYCNLADISSATSLILGVEKQEEEEVEKEEEEEE